MPVPALPRRLHFTSIWNISSLSTFNIFLPPVIMQQFIQWMLWRRRWEDLQANFGGGKSQKISSLAALRHWTIKPSLLFIVGSFLSFCWDWRIFTVVTDWRYCHWVCTLSSISHQTCREIEINQSQCWDFKMYQIWSIRTLPCNSLLTAIKHIFNKQCVGWVQYNGSHQPRIFPPSQQMSEILKFSTNWLLLAFTSKGTRTGSLDITESLLIDTIDLASVIAKFLSLGPA